MKEWERLDLGEKVNAGEKERDSTLGKGEDIGQRI